ncbi:MAG TPA: hypothetical protein VGL46_09620 [Pseudonocardiaceae bacterium]|jgi:hypothetical protein
MIHHYWDLAVQLLTQDPPPSTSGPPAPGSPPNPFIGVVPDFSFFGVKFNNAWKKLLAGVWGISFVVLAFTALRSVVELSRAQRGGHPGSVLENSDSAKRTGLALAALAGIGIIFGAVIALF